MFFYACLGPAAAARAVVGGWWPIDTFFDPGVTIGSSRPGVGRDEVDSGTLCAGGLRRSSGALSLCGDRPSWREPPNESSVPLVFPPLLRARTRVLSRWVHESIRQEDNQACSSISGEFVCCLAEGVEIRRRLWQAVLPPRKSTRRATKLPVTHNPAFLYSHQLNTSSMFRSRAKTLFPPSRKAKSPEMGCVFCSHICAGPSFLFSSPLTVRSVLVSNDHGRTPAFCRHAARPGRGHGAHGLKRWDHQVSRSFRCLSRANVWLRFALVAPTDFLPTL